VHPTWTTTPPSRSPSSTSIRGRQHR
jgi:hypothetical protein